MQALAHFSFGMLGAMIVLVFVDRPARQEILLIIASGIWAILPDFWWLFKEANRPMLADIGRSAHRSIVSNVFWLHPVLDNLETTRPKTEIAIMLVFLVIASIGYYRFNEWHQR